MNKNLYLILFLGFLACNTQKIANSNQKIFTKTDLQGDYKLNGGFVNVNLFLFDGFYYSIAKSCRGINREDGVWSYERDTLYLKVTKSTEYYDSTRIEKYLAIQMDSFLVLAYISENKKYMKKMYKELRNLNTADLNESSRGFLYKKLSK
jgi:hypothetical protein